MIINVLHIILLLQASSKVVCNTIDYVKGVPSFVMKHYSSGHCRKKIDVTFDSTTNNNVDDYMKSRKYKSNLLEIAVCFHSLGRFKEAKEFYGYIRQQFPEYAFPLVNIALIHLVNGKSQQVIETLDIYFHEVGGMFGNETKQIELIDSNAKIFGPHCLPKALYHLECVSALNAYGIAQVEKYNFETAMMSYLRAIELGNDDVYFISDVHQNLGSLYKTIGMIDDAADSFLRSFWSSVMVRKVVNPTPLIERAMLVPSISVSLEESYNYKIIFEKRIKDLMLLVEYGGSGWLDDSDLFKVRDYVADLDNIKALEPLSGTYNYMNKRVQNTHFYLHYYGYHDKPLQELVVSMYDKIRNPSLSNLILLKDSYQVSNLASRNASPFIPGHNPVDNPNTRQQGAKLRVVFISSHFGGNEPHGLLLIDVIKRLPSKIFECIAIIVGTNQPSQTFVDGIKGKYYSVGNNDSHVRELLVELSPDCLVFGEVMNNGMLFSLAQIRFAPLQVIVMGAPVTSGFSTIDYFISGDRLEHPFRTQMSGDKSDKEHYTEQLVLFDGQAISFPFDEYHPSQSAELAKGDAKGSINAAISANREKNNNDYYVCQYCNGYDQTTGLPIITNGGSMYLCFQNLFKIHPMLDKVFMTILQLDRYGHIILQAARHIDKTITVLHRIQHTITQKLCHQSPLEENTSNSTANASIHSSCDEAEQVLSRIHFIPRVTSQTLEKIYSKVNVILHPFPFGGSKTSSDAFKFGKPLVTFPQAYLRGRLASTFYSTMALHEVHPSLSSSICCVANSMVDYITKAVNLGQNKTYNNLVSKSIEQRKYRIYNDEQTSFEWARFLCRALGVTQINLEEGEDVIQKTRSNGDSENNVDRFLMREMEYLPKMWQEDSFLQEEMMQIQKRWKASKLEEAALLF